MENAEHGSNHGKRSVRRGGNHQLSMSDVDSTASQADSWHSPLRSESPFRSDDPVFQQENENPDNKNLKSLVSLDKYYTPVPSPGKPNFTAGSPNGRARNWRPWPHSEKATSENLDFPTTKGASPVVSGLNRLTREEPPHVVKRVDAVGDGVGLEEGVRSRAAVMERRVAVRKGALVFRVLEAIFCLVSFSVMAANKTKGWSGDSFDRYKEYRYCLVINVIGFTYSALQAFDLACKLGSGKYDISHSIRHHFDFAMDQILAYLLMSASSSAATRVDDWVSNWGKDEFTKMASASITMSFLAFVAFAISSLISGFNLRDQDST